MTDATRNALSLLAAVAVSAAGATAVGMSWHYAGVTMHGNRLMLHYVARRLIYEGAVIGDGDVRRIAEYVSQDGRTRLSDEVIGKYALRDIAMDSVVRSSMVAAEPDLTAPDGGSTAMVSVSAAQAVGLHPGLWLMLMDKDGVPLREAAGKPDQLVRVRALMTTGKDAASVTLAVELTKLQAGLAAVLAKGDPWKVVVVSPHASAR